ncbi:hypothetical protein TC41_0611 [Alicyclobacillus acidocaldarius subsp. acidocaldarius Tc-4-1]|uniref:ABC transporter permease n=1 Tax=Alicyclobacillus acidocaldarius (strain Tc-4-1) TaxID=1048834 RepID=F8IDA4_ALIAT|nr:hypothetical protein TC41_0611 [Alicyclobacillus acidocaldarius subsp. acidocaldarius Tc-4-1]
MNGWLIATPLVLARNWLLPFLNPDSMSLLRQNLERTALGQPAYQMDLSIFWAMLLGVLSLGLVTRRGEVLSLLAGPIRRKDVYTIHAGLTGGALVASHLLVLLYVCALDAIAGMPASPTLLVHVLLKRLLVYLAAWSLGVAAGATITSVALAYVCALGVAGFPMYVGTLIHYVDSKWAAMPSMHLYSDVIQLSPLTLLDTVTDASLAAYALWFAAWIACWLVLGVRLFERLPLELVEETFPFGAYRRLLALGISLLAGFILATWIDHAVNLGQGKAAAIEAVCVWLVGSGAIFAALDRAGVYRKRRWNP